MKGNCTLELDVDSVALNNAIPVGGIKESVI